MSTFLGLAGQITNQTCHLHHLLNSHHRCWGKGIQEDPSKKALVGGSEGSKKDQVLKVLINEALCKELQGSLVGTLVGERDVRCIQTTLYMEGFQSISVTYMGGNMTLLMSPIAGDVEKMWRSRKDSMMYYFSELKPWNPGLFVVQREGDELERDVRYKKQHWEENEEDRDISKYAQVSKGEDKVLTSEKSTNNPNSKEAILSITLGEAGVMDKDMEKRQTKQTTVLVDSRKELLCDTCKCGGTLGGGPVPAVDLTIEQAGLVDSHMDPLIDPIHEVGEATEQSKDPKQVGLEVDPVDPVSPSGCEIVGIQDPGSPKSIILGMERDKRYSSVSEPEEALSSHRAGSRKQISKLKKQKSYSKFNQLGAPKCIWLAEALTGGGGLAWSRRHKGDHHLAVVVGMVEGRVPSKEKSRVGDRDVVKEHRCDTLASGINLISGSGISRVAVSELEEGSEKARVTEADKLLGIQKEVGFTFEET
ncbi:hypothetical protein TSUD_57080 [Trifolium subterraneum]|uniref:DUF4283 domain-containing protein n=1 Tax=Trifolium subterraneum TaxID=3900 RepID=A0A2Z6MZ23_TRISU|nr:hypothetical protein TSUD_57080 [Trifolium subterraneum]